MPIAEQTIQTLEIVKEEEIAAPINIVFESILEQMGPYNEKPDGEAMPMTLEPWPGGRWFCDLGNSAGHWWGNVQAILSPTLLEISGPLFMSYPATSNVQYRLTEENGVTRLKFAHRAIGWIPDEMSESGVHREWEKVIVRVREQVHTHSLRGSVAATNRKVHEKEDLEPVRIETRKQMIVAGLKEHVASGGDPAIARLWSRFIPHLDEIPGQTGIHTYGVCWNLEDGGGLDYMTAVEVTGKEDVPLELIEENIPSSTFAVFAFHGHVSEIPRTMGKIYDWIAKNGREVRRERDMPGLIEVYGEDFDPKTASGYIEIWIPLR